MKTSADLISPGYLAEQVRLHAQPQGYGGKGRKWAELAAQVGRAYGCRTVLDYGCGQGSFGESLKCEPHLCLESYQDYDPVTFPDIPDPADLVVCTDVLEHVEPECVDAVIDHLAALTRTALLVVVSTVETAKTLSDGRQAHISLHDAAWWAAALGRRFRQVEQHAINPDKQWVAVLLPKET